MKINEKQSHSNRWYGAVNTLNCEMLCIHPNEFHENKNHVDFIHSSRRFDGASFILLAFAIVPVQTC